MVGIPQGSVLSTLLCSFFYGDLEKKFFGYTKDPEGVGLAKICGVLRPLIILQVVLRLIDDYLYITSSLTKARSFLEMMIRGVCPPDVAGSQSAHTAL
jgi:telomerase reverse transcriptase